ncbi:MAG: ABC transporter ATP-binding protein [Deltaproteobacteria bacterium]|nr:ABC transporter ATP-binding protein [Deltaproteobacteria bacterium]
MTPVVEAIDIKKNYGAFTAVDGVSFKVQPGECYGLLGPNGAGKTSIIRMMYGFSPLSSGRMLLFGQDIEKDWRVIRSRIGVCQQGNTLDPDLSVEENLVVFAGYFSMPAARARARTAELMQLFALEKKRKAKVVELSGGLARRLMVARSLINEPELLILDEPTTGLDPQSRHLLWEKLMALRKSGVTLFLTTHYMEEASHLCDRLMIIDRGKILAEDSPRSLIERYVEDAVVEIEGTNEDLRQYLVKGRISHDVLDQRIIVYARNSVGEHIGKNFCAEKCTFRAPTLEDVFLRLTGRELRE